MLTRQLNIIKILGDNSSCMLFGPRGVGKTALVRNFLVTQPSVIVFDLLDREVYQQHLTSPGLFRSQIVPRIRSGSILTVFVDEIQKLPALLDDVHSLIEEDFRSQEKRVRFILSGSSARKLKRGSANLLAGRAFSLKLFPLNILECDLSLSRALSFGTLPAFYLGPENPTRALKSYAETYIREEVLQESLVRNGQGFEKFLDFAAQVNGEPVNFSKLAKVAGISSPTAESYFSILVDILLAYRIDVWSYSERVKIATAPKYYFFDCGVLNALRGELSVPLKPSTYRYGKLFETFIINQILAANSYLERDFKPHFWRTQTGREVDLVLARNPGDTPRAIEIKSEASPGTGSFSDLLEFKRANPKAELYCLCETTKRYEHSGVTVLPWKEGVVEVLS